MKIKDEIKKTVDDRPQDDGRQEALETAIVFLHTHTTRGVSLLIVVLIGSIMIMAATTLGALALRTLKNAQTRTDAVQGTYSAEDAFACVRYWLDRNIGSFADKNPLPNTVTCGDTTAGYTITQDTASFSIGNTKVTVTHSPTADKFTVRVYAQNTGAEAEKLAEKFQEYEYTPRISADIMLLVDTSGSIAGDRNAVRDNHVIELGNEWEALIAGLSDSVTGILAKTPHPTIGVVTFGTNIYDTAKLIRVDNTLCGPTDATCLLVPNIRLTTRAENIVSDVLPNNGGTYSDPYDDTADITVGDFNGEFAGYFNFPAFPKTATNLSLALGVAGSELMGKAYYATGTNAGFFEQTVASNPDNLLTVLDDLSGGLTKISRDTVPHWIIVITDGEPNAIISHMDGDYMTSAQDLTTGLFTSPILTHYTPGMTKLFRTTTAATGPMISEDVYHLCADGTVETPDMVLSPDNREDVDTLEVDAGYSNTPNTSIFSRVSMCNATRIAEALKKPKTTGGPGIVIAAIGVGITSGGYAEQWLTKDFVSDGAGGDPLYKSIGSYNDLVNAVDFLASQMSLLQST